MDTPCGEDEAVRMRRDLPTGTVTFVFTDIEGSTRMLERLGADAYGELLSQRWTDRPVALAPGRMELPA